jgi:hypothetical protein
MVKVQKASVLDEARTQGKGGKRGYGSQAKVQNSRLAEIGRDEVGKGGRRYMNISLLCLQSRPSDETRREQERGSERKEQESNQKKKDERQSNPSSTQVKTTDKLTRQR